MGRTTIGQQAAAGAPGDAEGRLVVDARGTVALLDAADAARVRFEGIAVGVGVSATWRGAASASGPGTSDRTVPGGNGLPVSAIQDAGPRGRWGGFLRLHARPQGRQLQES